MSDNGQPPPSEPSTEPFEKLGDRPRQVAPQLSRIGSREMSRRSILAGLGVGSLAATAVGDLLGAGPAAATGGPTGAGPDAAGNPGAKKLGGPSPVVSPSPGDFSVRASCDLTEDYFLTSEIVLNASNGDRVIPFVNPLNNDMVEAIVLVQGLNGAPGSVSHLARDLSVTSGWSYTQLDLTSTVPWPIDVAVVADSKNAYLMVLADPSQGGPGPAWLSQLDSAAGWDDGYVASYDDLGYTDLQIDPTSSTLGALKGGIDAAGNVSFYASVVAEQTTYLVGWVVGSGWASGSVNYQLMQILDSSQESITDYLVIFDATNSAHPVGYSLVLDSGTDLTPYRQLAYTNQNSPQFDDSSFISGLGNQDVTELIWAWATPGSTTGQPGFAFQQQNDPDNGITAGTIFVDESGNEQTLSDQSTVGNNAVAVWQDNGLYTVNLLDPEDTLNTTAQYDDGSGSTWGVAVPIGVGLTGIYGVPTDPHEATLFAVDPGGVLNVLTKGAIGWTQNLVHQSAASAIEVAAWRCQIGLYDSNGVGVGNSKGSVQLSTSLPIDIWQDNASVVLLPGSPIVLVPDATGQVSVAIPTSELDTAQLAAQPLDGNGNNNGPALTIVPNTDTQNYLAGTGTLSSTGGSSLSGSALVNAQSSGSWDSTSQSYTTSGPLMPVLGTAGASAADQVAQGINHVMSLPTNSPGSGDTQAALLDLTGATPSFQTSTDPTAFDAHKTGDTSWWDKAEHDIESVFHGLRHAALLVGKMISTWASDVAQWTINLVVDLGDGIDRLMSWVVNGIEDAYHAISSFFHSLGTDIEHIGDWLKNLVMGALHDATANAAYLESWLTNLVDFATDEINDAESFTAGFFKGLETDVNSKLTTLQDQVEGELFGTHTEQPTPPPGTGGDDSGSHFEGVQDVFHFLAHSPASWLMKKILADIQPLTGSAITGIELSNFSQPMNDLAGDVDEAIDTVIDAATLLANLLGDAAQSPTSFNAQSMTELFTGFENVVDDILTLLDNLTNTLLDLLKAFIEYFDDFLTAEFQAPLVGEILRLCGVEPTLSIQHLVALMIAYPATLLHALFAAAAGGAGQPLFPFEAPAGSLASRNAGVGNSDSDWSGFGLDVASAVVQFIWATIDVGLEMITYDSNEPSPADLVFTNVFTAIDILCPIMLTILQWPVPPTYTGTQTPAPFAYGDFDDGSVWGTDYQLLPYIFVSGGIPWLVEAIGFVASLIAPTDSDVNNFNNQVVPLQQTVASAANVVLSSWYSYANATNDGEKTLAIIPPIISNLSYLDSIIASDQAKDALGDQVPWFKFYIDTFGNYATVAIDVGEAIAAAAK